MQGVKCEITEEVLKEVEEMASLGMLEKDIALCLGINATTFSGKKAESTQLSEAIKRGNAKGIRLATNALRQCIADKEIAAIIYYLKVKGEWREPEKIDNSIELVRKDIADLKQELNACKKMD